ncbi:hypothetical protein ONZ45_g3834 [Pleurotus djamor]|nr:hypothetical protein ONZ45_g3834 [Pleurotus djamor]
MGIKPEDPNSPMPIATRQLGRNGPKVSAIGLGTMAMGLSSDDTHDELAFRTLTRAADAGINFWDTADRYGRGETVLGRWFAQTGRRSEIILATKFGASDLSNPARAAFPNSKPSYIKWQVENSLKALQTDYIDLYYQHRVDPEVPIEVTMTALGELIESGKIRWIGLSECSIETLKRAKAVPGVGEKVIAVQMEFSPLEISIEKNGFADAAKELGVGIVTYSPLARGFISGRYRSPEDFGDARKLFPRFSPENFPKNLAIVDKLKVVADAKGITTSQATIAWILASHPDFIPIPGVTNPDRIAENVRATEVLLSDEEVAEIRVLIEEADVVGDRYPLSWMVSLKGDTLPLSEWKGEKTA